MHPSRCAAQESNYPKPCEALIVSNPVVGDCLLAAGRGLHVCRALWAHLQDNFHASMQALQWSRDSDVPPLSWLQSQASTDSRLPSARPKQHRKVSSCPCCPNHLYPPSASLLAHPRKNGLCWASTTCLGQHGSSRPCMVQAGHQPCPGMLTSSVVALPPIATPGSQSAVLPPPQTAQCAHNALPTDVGNLGVAQKVEAPSHKPAG